MMGCQKLTPPPIQELNPFRKKCDFDARVAGVFLEVVKKAHARMRSKIGIKIREFGNIHHEMTPK